MAYHFYSLPSKNKEEVLYEYLRDYGLEFYDRLFMRNAIIFKKQNEVEIELRVSHMIQKKDETTIVPKESLESILRIGLQTISSYSIRATAYDFASEVCSFKTFNNFVNFGETIKMTVTYVEMERGQMRARGRMWCVLDNLDRITMMPLLEGSAVIQVCRPQIIEKVLSCQVCEPSPTTHFESETVLLITPRANQKYDITTDDDLFVLHPGAYDGIEPGDRITKINGATVLSRDHLDRLCRFMEPLQHIEVVRTKQKNTTPTREELSKRLKTYTSQEGFLTELITISKLPPHFAILHSDQFPLVFLGNFPDGSKEGLQNGDVVLEVNGEPVSCTVQYEIEKVLEELGEATVTVERATSDESKKMVEEMLMKALAAKDKQLKRRKRVQTSPKPKRGPVASLELGDEVRIFEGSGDGILYSYRGTKPAKKNSAKNMFDIFDEPSDSASMPEVVPPQNPNQNKAQGVPTSRKKNKETTLKEINDLQNPKVFPTRSNGGGHLDPVAMESEKRSNSEKVAEKHDRPFPEKSTPAVRKTCMTTKTTTTLEETQSIPDGFFDSPIHQPAPTEEVARSVPNEKESVDMIIRTLPDPEVSDNRARPDSEVELIQLSMDSLYPGYRTPNEEESCPPLPSSLLCRSNPKFAGSETKRRKRKFNTQSASQSLSEMNTFNEDIFSKEQKVKCIEKKSCIQFSFVNVVQSEDRSTILLRFLKQMGVKGDVEFAKPIRMPVFGNKFLYSFKLEEDDGKLLEEATECRSSWKEKLTVKYLAEGNFFLSEMLTIDNFITTLLFTTLATIDETLHLPESIDDLLVPQAQSKIVRSKYGADVLLALQKILWKPQIQSLQALRSLSSSK
ncbi:hypothetical protein B9Z55_010421 [Caenorhabditis nigoni]|uniref:PDZ domain-containing protein n=1 Tax=Caenorhabditis nigoni TaxID=1611254 RepID=A0A2G5UG07_9PELO|nr:hypothetical protein B9Z55_010421 [Caenorhabditis nigoni]